MKTKQEFYNAGLTKTLFKTLLGIFGLFCFYFLWIWSSFELQTALGTSIGMLILGPIVLFPLIFFIRFTGAKKLKWKQNPELSEIYLSQILIEPGPQIRVWVEKKEKVPTLFWMENPFSRSSKQEVFVSSSWLKLNEKLKQESLLLAWSQINSMGRGQRLLRTIQIAYWVGLLWPLEAILWVFKRIQIFIGLGDLPFLSFWIQRLTNSFKKFLLSENKSDQQFVFKRSRIPEGAHFESPDVWSSVLWGPWYMNCSEFKHPFWNFLGFE